MKILILVLNVLLVANVLSTVLLGFLVVEFVNWKLPKNQQKFSRWAVIEACSIYPKLYPGGRLAIAFYVSCGLQFAVFAGYLLASGYGRHAAYP